MDYSLIESGNIVSIIPSGELSYNTQYIVTVSTGLSGVHADNGNLLTLEEDFNFCFTSTYCPLFTTISMVKMEVGPQVNKFTDDAIYRMIYKNSLYAIDIYNNKNGTNVSYSHFGCKGENAPFELKRFVLCKTAYDLLQVMKSMGGTSSSSKTLGDLSIKYGGPSTASADDPNQLKDLYDCWKNILRSLTGINTAVRGKFDETKSFPHPARDVTHNRVVKVTQSRRGPWQNSPIYRGTF